MSVEKLQGVTDYRGWRRSMEIALSAKRKLGLVTRAVKKEENDEERAEMWNTCNDIYLITIEARKYQLNKNVYDAKQNSISVNEYYTYMQGIWEELDSLNVWPILSVVSEQMQGFLDVLNKQKDEQKLFQFLTGLNETYNTQRSHILMMTPLPSVEMVCSMIQQEESQREVCMSEKNELEISAICRVPKWHPKHKNYGGNMNNNRGREQGGSTGTSISAQKLEQLLKLLPSGSKNLGVPSEPEDDFEHGFANMVTCCHATSIENEWIIDLGASDHMTGDLSVLKHPKEIKCGNKINFPNGLTFENFMGACRVETRGKHRYFLTIVNDCSRNTWVHLLEEKLDAFKAIEEFILMVENQFNKTMKIVRLDNGMEFEDHRSKALFGALGIVHQTRCVGRPQQNGRVERNLCNILEMERALRFQAGLPLQFWGDFVLTAAYITNRVPTPILHNKTAYAILHNTKPDYSQMKAMFVSRDVKVQESINPYHLKSYSIPKPNPIPPVPSPPPSPLPGAPPILSHPLPRINRWLFHFFKCQHRLNVDVNLVLCHYQDDVSGFVICDSSKEKRAIFRLFAVL
ncbi:uncharacterized protein LOC130828647 [Amaranthus tricolor]|uniref:uncharacterized protein LOC130828647 n=1 Tax=Amaranthus tricolor TaxID=29722 RepID=UPI0025888A65|nr:uncharacterized protein LOC130828647 [Amaranthus tricolor]